MKKIIWNNGMNLGVKAIDDDHKRLLDTINELYDAINSNNEKNVLNKIFDTLEEYIKEHFTREENLMRECDYERLDEHIKQHEKFKRKIPKLRAKLLTTDEYITAQEVSIYLTDWLINHILSEDLLLINIFEENGYTNKKRKKTSLLSDITKYLISKISFEKRISFSIWIPLIGIFLLSTIVFWNNYETYSDMKNINNTDILISKINSSLDLIKLHDKDSEKLLLEQYTKISKDIKEYSMNMNKQVNESIQKNIFILLSCGVFIFFITSLSLFITNFLNKSSLKKIHTFTQAMKKLAQGDRSFKLDVISNEDDIDNMVSSYEINRLNLIKGDVFSQLYLYHKEIELENINRINLKLEEIAFFDHLTGAINRRKFEELSNNEFKRSMRYDTPVSFLMIDIDHFKVVNDTYGHGIGDEVLKHLSAICKDSIRSIDLFARIGGEEFIIMLPQTDEENAYVFADRLRKKIDKSIFLSEDINIHYTVSIGLTNLYKDKDKSVKDILKRVDLALYEAKESGRNCVVKYIENKYS